MKQYVNTNGCPPGWGKDFSGNWVKIHGGKRKGAGRPKKEPTITMRIPISKVEAVKKLIHD